MIPIELRYRPLRWLPWTRTLRTFHPQGWEELDPAQLIAIACVYRGTLSDDGLISSMLGIKRRVARKLASYQKFKIIELISWIRDYQPYHAFIIRKLGKYRAPKQNLKDETFGTFIFAETYYTLYSKGGDATNLNKFIACWYRDQPFDEHTIERRATAIGAVDLVTREAILINYGLIREYFVKTYPYVFQRAAEETTTEDRSSWVDVFDAIVGDDLKDQDRYAELPISSVLRYLDKRIKKSLEDESKLR